VRWQHSPEHTLKWHVIIETEAEPRLVIDPNYKPTPKENKYHHALVSATGLTSAATSKQAGSLENSAPNQ
jgi:hypothetical protein